MNLKWTKPLAGTYVEIKKNVNEIEGWIHGAVRLPDGYKFFYWFCSLNKPFRTARGWEYTLRGAKKSVEEAAAGMMK